MEEIEWDEEQPEELIKKDRRRSVIFVTDGAIGYSAYVPDGYTLKDMIRNFISEYLSDEPSDCEYRYYKCTIGTFNTGEEEGY